MNNYFSNLLGDPFWLFTIAMGVAGWCIAFVGSIIDNIQEPKRFPIFGWWGLAFQFLVSLLVVYAVVSNRIHQYRHALIAFLSLATVYSSNSTNNFVWRSTPTTCGVISAGQILLSIVNILWMFYLGTSHDEPVHAFVASFASAKYPPDYRRTGGRSPNPNRFSRDFAGHNGGYGSQMALPQAYPTQMYTSDNVRGNYDDNESHLNDGRPLSVLSGSTDQSDSLSLPTDYPYKARALYSYTANPEDSNEITFEKDEVLDISDITGRWWQARRANGEVGICPSNYVVLL